MLPFVGVAGAGGGDSFVLAVQMVSSVARVPEVHPRSALAGAEDAEVRSAVMANGQRVGPYNETKVAHSQRLTAGPVCQALIRP